MPKKTPAARPAPEYISNPFTVFINSFKALGINLNTLILLYLIAIAAFIVPVILFLGALGIGEASGRPNIGLSAGAVAVVLLLVVLVAIFQVAFLVYSLKTARGQKVQVGETLRVALEKTLPMLGLILLVILIVAVGLLLLIIPGLIFTYWFMFAPYVLIDQDVGIVEALRRSRALVKGKIVEIGGMAGAGFIFSLPSMIPFVGNIYELVFTPVAQISWAYRYASARQLQEAKAAKPANDPANWWAMLAVLLIPLLILIIVLLSLIGGATQN